MEEINIGLDAGKIWQVLNVKGEAKITDLKKITKMDVKNIYLALGWLAKENKVHFFELEEELGVCLIQ